MGWFYSSNVIIGTLKSTFEGSFIKIIMWDFKNVFVCVFPLPLVSEMKTLWIKGTRRAALGDLNIHGNSKITL